MGQRQNETIFNDRFVRVICIGAGPSGICLAYKLQRSFKKFSLRVRLATTARAENYQQLQARFLK